MLRRWAQLTRAHTAPLEAVPALLGALLATGGEFTSTVALWTLFGVLYHLGGYGMNSWADWKNGFDKDDPHKQHHPLNRGAIREFHARVGVTVLLTATGVLGVLIASNIGTVAMIISMFMAGIIYNELGKLSWLKPFPISIAHSLVFAAPYYSISGSIDGTLIIGTLYVFTWVLFQIGVSGEVKDVAQDGEENILRTLGVYQSITGDGLVYGLLARWYSYTLRTMVVGVGIVYGLYLGVGTAGFLLITALGAYSMFLTKQIMESDRRRRDDELKTMARIEMLSLAVMVAGSYPVVGVKIAGLIFPASVAWVLSLNKLEWGTWIKPDV